MDEEVSLRTVLEAMGMPQLIGHFEGLGLTTSDLLHLSPALVKLILPQPSSTTLVEEFNQNYSAFMEKYGFELDKGFKPDTSSTEGTKANDDLQKTSTVQPNSADQHPTSSSVSTPSTDNATGLDKPGNEQSDSDEPGSNVKHRLSARKRLNSSSSESSESSESTEMADSSASESEHRGETIVRPLVDKTVIGQKRRHVKHADAKVDELNLKKFLKRNGVEGKGILASYKTYDILSFDDQNTLCKLLCQWLLKVSNYAPKHHHYEVLTEKICKLFPKESPKLWYIPPKTESTGQICKRGKLPDKIRNLKEKLRKQGLLDRKKKPKKGEETDDLVHISISEEETTSMEWLKRNAEPFSQVKIHWKMCQVPRLKELLLTKNLSPAQYVQNWNSILKLPEAPELIIDDFEALPKVVPEKYSTVSGKGDNLLRNWKNFSNKVIEILKTNGTKKEINLFTTQLDSAINDNTKDYILLSILPILCKKRGFVKVGTVSRRPSCAESSNAFMMTVSGAAEFQEQVRQRTKRYTDLKLPIQPYVAVILQDKTNVTASYTIVDDIIWRTGSVLTAVDVCLKACFALDCSYAPEAAHLWLLIQKALYQIELCDDVSCSSVTNLISRLG